MATLEIRLVIATTNRLSSISLSETGCAEGFAASLNTLVALVHLRNREWLKNKKEREENNEPVRKLVLFTPSC